MSESKPSELTFPCVDYENKPIKLVLAFADGQVKIAILPDAAPHADARLCGIASSEEMRRMAHAILSVLGPHPEERDLRPELACFALSGLAPEFHKSGADESADAIAKRAVELADATVSALRSTPKATP
jgi:hypothetical protein